MGETFIHREQYHGQVIEIELPTRRADQKETDYTVLCRSIINKRIRTIQDEALHAAPASPVMQRNQEVIMQLTGGKSVTPTTRVHDLLAALPKRHR